MSEENIEIARRMIELANRGDADGVAAHLSPDVVSYPAEDQPESTPLRGRDAWAEYARGWLEVFDRYVIEPSEYLDLGDCVVIVGRVTARGRGSGAETAENDAWLYRFREGLVVEHRECGTRERALEAARRDR